MLDRLIIVADNGHLLTHYKDSQMSRSVYVPRDAHLVAFSTVEADDWFDWNEFCEDYAESIASLFPSAYRQKGWAGNEGHIVAQNGLAQFGMSEYCGLVAYWIIPHTADDVSEALATNWIESIAAKFQRTFGTLRHVATASNGEAFFQRID